MDRKRVDGNQATLVLQLRTAGYEVVDYHAAGHGVPDIVMGRDGHYEWVEIKSSARSNLTKAERAFFAHCPGGPPILACTAALAIAEFERRFPPRRAASAEDDGPAVENARYGG